MNTRHFFIALAMGAAFAVSGCEKIEVVNDNVSGHAPAPLIVKDGISVKKVCLNGVNYYATRIVPHVGPTYWSVGGAVFTKDSPTPQTCEQ